MNLCIVTQLMKDDVNDLNILSDVQSGPHAMIIFCILSIFAKKMTVEKFLEMNTGQSNYLLVNMACMYGNGECLEYFHEQLKWGLDSEEFTELVVNGGYLDCLVYLHNIGCPVGVKCLGAAAENGFIGILEYLHENNFWNNGVINYAAKGGHMDCLVFCHKMGATINITTMNKAARSGNLECLKYLHDNGCLWNSMTSRNASESGSLEILKYLHENGCPWDEWTCSYASMRGHLDCLKYAHENGCPWNENTCSGAAMGGFIDCLKYAHENGCPWINTTCTSAASNGHLDCLIYAFSNGCPWDEYVARLSAKNGFLDCLKYSLENGCPNEFNDLMRYCTVYNNGTCVEFLKEIYAT